MQHFLCKLTPPRPSFAQDMTAHEAQIMQDHVKYWSDLAERGSVILFGPVADPEGAWGVAVLEAADRDAVDSITASDPVTLQALGMRYDVYSMPVAICGRRQAFKPV